MKLFLPPFRGAGGISRPGANLVSVSGEYPPGTATSGTSPPFGGAKGIRLSNASFTANSAQGTAIGNLSVVGGTGTYTFTLTDSHTNAVQVAGTNGVNLQAGSAVSSAGSFSITVHADNGAGSTFNKSFLITATGAAFTPSLNLSDARDSQYLTLGII